MNNFVTERNAAEVMAVGLNAIRELCNRCPLALDETALRDLAAYKTYKDKGVMMAARSLILLYRNTFPELLHKKDRGRPTEAMAEGSGEVKRKYGEFKTKGYIPGAEVVDEEGQNDEEVEDEEENEGWIDVSHSEDEDEDTDEDNEEGEFDNEMGFPNDKVVNVKNEKKEHLTIEEKREKAAEIASSRILTDADFRKIEAAQLKKQVSGFRKGKKRKREESVDEEDIQNPNRQELVKLSDIEMVHKKRKHDKEARMATVLEGRKDREKFGSRKGKANENASSTHKEKNKRKNFMMVKHKLKSKAKRSFAEKARDLKRSMLRSRKFK